MKIVITGATGMLGSDLMRVVGSTYDVVGLSSKDANITDLDKIVGLIESLKPDLVIHSAANTDVDGCELNPDATFLVNSIGTRNVALACQRINAALMYISTDYVFDGQKPEPYVEWDQPNPVNTYGRSKLAGEKYVSELLSRFYIIRSSWLYGKLGRNFVYTILKATREGKKRLTIVDDQVGSPTYTYDLATKISEIIEKERYGIYHITNSNYCSWFEFTKQILRLAFNAAGHEISLVPIKSHEYATPTRRPNNSVLRNYVLELERIPLLRPWDAALGEFLSGGND
jgi:dTDP-4-dehydrorhamnose reductase